MRAHLILILGLFLNTAILGADAIDRDLFAWSACDAPGLPTLTGERVSEWLKESVELTPEQTQKIKDLIPKWNARVAARKDLENSWARFRAIPMPVFKSHQEADNSEYRRQYLALQARENNEFPYSKGPFVFEIRDAIKALLKEPQYEKFRSHLIEKFATVAATIQVQKSKDKTTIEGKLLGQSKDSLGLLVNGKEVVLNSGDLKSFESQAKGSSVSNPFGDPYKISRPGVDAWPEQNK